MTQHRRERGGSIIIGFGKIQSYQWFANNKQEVLV